MQSHGVYTIRCVCVCLYVQVRKWKLHCNRSFCIQFFPAILHESSKEVLSLGFAPPHFSRYCIFSSLSLVFPLLCLLLLTDTVLSGATCVFVNNKTRPNRTRACTSKHKVLCMRLMGVLLCMSFFFLLSFTLIYSFDSLFFSSKYLA